MKAQPDENGHRNAEDFVLQNDPPRAKPAEFANNERSKQRVMFSGLHLPPNTRNLFDTDGFLSEDE